MAIVLVTFSLGAHALPTGGTIAAGTGGIAQSGSTLTVNQGSQNLAINWQGFSIGAKETVNFVQPNAFAISLNRVLGADGTQILGRLNANGQVWILNPNGVLFGKGAQVNVGGLVASTLNLSDADFLAGKRTFSGNGGSITNRGSINANYVALLGEQVKNDGVIVANLGTVALAAGNKVTLDFAGDKLLGVQVDEGALHALADNKKLIQADGGLVVMTAKAKDALLDTAVNNSGIVRARTLENRQGRILLLGDMDSGTVNVGGTLDASAPTTGNGGFIETSAAYVKVADGTKITTKAAHGKSGTWLIDPVDFTIAAGSGALTTSGIGATTLSASLGLGNVAIATDVGTGGNGDIFVNSAVTWAANKLTLTAHRNIEINANLNGSGTASLALEYGQNAVAAGNTATYRVSNGAKVSLPAGANFSTKLGNDGATTPWTVITALGAAGSVTGTDLQGMNGNKAGKYVLGADIDASTTNTWNANAGFTPVGTNATKFTGSFDGLGHTITGLTINSPGWNVPANYYQGLFGYSTGSLSNIGLLNSSISGANIVGALAGRSDGAIRNSYADGGSVSASVHQAGGLVGALGGTGSISNSYANVSVTGTDYACCGGGVSSTAIGGLVGMGLAGFSISNSYATGSVSGGTDVGGLVGQTGTGTISNSYATGAVSGGSFVGGLSGSNGGGAQVVVVTNSYWDTQTSGRATSYGGTGKTTAQMKQLATFAAWDIDDAAGTVKVWRIYGDNSTPLLRSFLTPLTVTANNATTTYSGTAYSGGNGVSYSTAPNANLLGTASYGGSSQGAISVGSYVITPSGPYSNQRGYDIAFANGALTINPATLTVTANNASKTYDGNAYSGGNGVAYSGFVNGETSAVLGGTLALGGTFQGATNVGSYAITPSGLTSSNYAISFANGTLTINPLIPAIPGAPIDGYAGAIASLPGGKTAITAPTLLTSVESTENRAAPTLPGIPGFSIQLCGQALPSKAAKDCQ